MVTDARSPGKSRTVGGVTVAHAATPPTMSRAISSTVEPSLTTTASMLPVPPAAMEIDDELRRRPIIGRVLREFFPLRAQEPSHLLLPRDAAIRRDTRARSAAVGLASSRAVASFPELRGTGTH